ncbi:MFS general substrate transporter [Pholiota conissans]|uniref:MFS general substrate transporter n=1 Tax=Pholiota conissans TaxID=109636 RepID=A0A9P5Z3M8_9AGAR|nr:MFS general substrate transporter [Pholiota conissans]
MSDEEKHASGSLDQPVSTMTSEVTTQSTRDVDESKFTKNEKWFIVIFTAFVGFFSPLTANIYFPAIPTLAKAFNKSTELINLTVTMYVVLQGFAPMFWGPVSDHIGRRPVSAACLLILSLSCVGLALVPISDFWLLMLLRCIQACGSASTIAIGAGVVGDISSRAERGGFFGIFSLGPTSGPAFGPVIGGALAGHFGWRAIFWFLCICASVCFTFIILFQPETLRPIVNAGRDTTFLIYKPVIPIIGRNKPHPLPAPTLVPTPKPQIARNPFRLFLNPDVSLMLAINGIMFTTFYGVLVPLSSLFVTTYPFLTQTTIGVCFMCIGAGTVFGSWSSGRILDMEYRTFRRRAERDFMRRGEGDEGFDIAKEENFPLEKARLRLMPYYICAIAALCAGYGWVIEKKVHIAVPLIMQFIAGWITMAVMNATSTLNIDLVPGQSSSVTACNNLVRCSLTAILVSVIQLIIDKIGIGWTYVLLSGFSLMSLPLVYIGVKIGPRCRVRRQLMRQAQSLQEQQAQAKPRVDLDSKEELEEGSAK